MSRSGTRFGLVIVLAAVVGVTGYQMVWPWLDRGGAPRRDIDLALQQRDFHTARSRLNQSLAARPDDVALLLLAAQTARRAGDFETASRHLDAYHAKHGPRGPLELEHRLLRVQRGDVGEAESLLDSCLAQPHDPQTPLVLEAILEGWLNDLARLFAQGVARDDATAARRAARARQAVDFWQQHQRSLPNQAQGLVWSGRLHALAADHAKAVRDLRQALKLDPEYFEARLHLATLIAQEAPLETVAHFETIRQRQPENLVVLYTLAAVRRNLGELAEAQRLLDELLTVQPNHVAGLIERGKVAMDLNRQDEAEKWLRRALDLEPGHADANLTMSRCLLHAGRESDAKRFRARFENIKAGREPGQDLP